MVDSGSWSYYEMLIILCLVGMLGLSFFDKEQFISNAKSFLGVNIISLIVAYFVFVINLKIMSDHEFTFKDQVDIRDYASVSLMLFSRIIIITDVKSPKLLLIQIIMIISSTVLISSDNLLLFYVSLELQSFALYVIAGRDKSSSGLLYFIVGALASAFVLLGRGIVFAETSSLDITEIANYPKELANLGIFIILFGLRAKLAMFPFIAWYPDLVDSLSYKANILIGIIPKFSIFIVMVNIINRIDPEDYTYRYILKYISLITIAVVPLRAIKENRIKRLLAYSSSVNAGYIVTLRLSGGFNTNTVFMYILQYLAISIIIWAALDINYQQIDRSRFMYKYEISTTHILQGRLWRSPGLALALAVSLMSVAGLPPFIGFYAKLSLINEVTYEVLPMIIIICSSALMTMIYLRFIILIVTPGHLRNNWSDEPELLFYLSTLVILIVSLVPGRRVWFFPLIFSI